MAVTPSTTQQITDHNYVSSLDTTELFHQYQVDPKLQKRYGSENITGFLKETSRMVPVEGIEYHHYEESRLHEIVKVDAIAAGAPDTAVTHTVQTAYRYTSPPSAQTPYLSTGSPAATILPRKQDLLLFDDGTKGIVTAVAGNTYTVEPLVSGENIPQMLVTSEVVIYGNAHEEQTDQPNSRNSRVEKYTNNLFIHKGSHLASGTEMAQVVWVEVEGGYVWYLKGAADERRRMENECEMVLMEGEKVTNTTLAGVQPKLTVTEGYLPFIRNYGNNVNYSSITGFELSDLDNIVKTLVREEGAPENTMHVGINASISIDNMGLDLAKDTGASYITFNGDKELAARLQFRSFHRAGYTFHKQDYKLFNHKKLFGATGHPYRDYIVVTPTDEVVDPKTGETVDSFRMRYAQANGYSRLSEEWFEGGANGVYTNGLDQWKVNFRSHVGFEAFAANRHLIAKPL